MQPPECLTNVRTLEPKFRAATHRVQTRLIIMVYRCCHNACSTVFADAEVRVDSLNFDFKLAEALFLILKPRFTLCEFHVRLLLRFVPLSVCQAGLQALVLNINVLVAESVKNCDGGSALCDNPCLGSFETLLKPHVTRRLFTLLLGEGTFLHKGHYHTPKHGVVHCPQWCR